MNVFRDFVYLEGTHTKKPKKKIAKGGGAIYFFFCFLFVVGALSRQGFSNPALGHVRFVSQAVLLIFLFRFYVGSCFPPPILENPKKFFGRRRLGDFWLYSCYYQYFFAIYEKKAFFVFLLFPVRVGVCVCVCVCVCVRACVCVLVCVRYINIQVY